jgi:hypothetical protein
MRHAWTKFVLGTNGQMTVPLYTDSRSFLHRETHVIDSAGALAMPKSGARAKAKYSHTG